VKNVRRVMVCTIFAAVGFGVGAPAWAQTSGQGTYTGVPTPQLGGQQVGGVVAQPATLQSKQSTLPFTGSDVAELAGIGVVLIGTGALLRRSARGRRTVQ
jgi:hypothetical protein